ncbi:MAG: energy transducer TonB [Chloracidobacterium sp.]|nr:energy transducer TonB [Chloracidobacterium sp.]
MLRPTLIGLSISILGSVVFAQSGEAVSIVYERKVISGPKVPIPDSAVKTGLGGLVRVPVIVDASGNVVDVGEPTGPGHVCQQVTRPDVLALRDVSAKASLLVKLEPVDASEGITRSLVGFNFPEKTVRSTTGTEYKGPVSASPDNKEELKVDRWGDRTFSGPLPTVRIAQPSELNENGEVKGGVLNGKATDLAKPRYPPAALAVKASGTVSVQVLIDTDGGVFSAEAVSGHPLLRPASVVAACDAKFTPMKLESGEPIKVIGLIVYNFVP